MRHWFTKLTHDIHDTQYKIVVDNIYHVAIFSFTIRIYPFNQLNRNTSNNVNEQKKSKPQTLNHNNPNTDITQFKYNEIIPISVQIRWEMSETKCVWFFVPERSLELKPTTWRDPKEAKGPFTPLRSTQREALGWEDEAWTSFIATIPKSAGKPSTLICS